MSPSQQNAPAHGHAVAVVTIAAAALLAVAAGAARAADDPPYTLAREGFFYVGGKPTVVNGRTYMAGQMYVDVRIPAKQTQPYPIIMVHGGTRSATTYFGTPDGREGWAQYFVRQGYAVYVVDQPGRGRSGYLAEAYGPWKVPDGDGGQRRYLSQAKYKLWPQAHLHTQWPGAGKPGDPAFDQFYASQFPSIVSFPKQQEINRDALVALLDKIGPAILLTHSQSGAFNWPVADARPNLIKALVAVEPSGPPVHDIENTGAPDWFKDAERTKVSGLADVPLAYDPPVPAGGALEFVRQDKPDKPDLVRCWLQKEPARQLPNLKRIPVVIIMSEASYHAAYDHCTAAYLNQAGVPNTFIRLADVGVRGNGHMMMIEKNNAAIAGVIAQWLDRQRLHAPQAAR